MCESACTFGFDELKLGDAAPANPADSANPTCFGSVAKPEDAQAEIVAILEIPIDMGLLKLNLIMFRPLHT